MGSVVALNDGQETITIFYLSGYFEVILPNCSALWKASAKAFDTRE